MTTAFMPQTRTGQALAYFWDMIDISDNMGRVEDWVITISAGKASAIHALVFSALTLVALALTWFYDLQSTIAGMSTLTDQVIPSLPEQTAKLTWWVIVAFTLLPTFLEIFTAGLAKQDIKIVQIAIIVFTLFDVVTDIPRAYQLAMNMWPQISLLGWVVSDVTFWLFFMAVLGFATIGFELLAVLFGYATVLFIWQTFHGEGSYNWNVPVRAPRPRQRPHAPRAARRPRTATTVDLGNHMPAQATTVDLGAYAPDVVAVNGGSDDDLVIVDATQ